MVSGLVVAYAVVSLFEFYYRLGHCKGSSCIKLGKGSKSLDVSIYLFDTYMAEGLYLDISNFIGKI